MKKIILVICLAIFSYTSKAQIYYVNPSATGTNDGSSWANAFTYLQNCLATVNSGEVWVAAGTYYPGTSGSNSATFLMEDNLAIYGGFNGTETLLSQRNPLTNVTILSGDLDQSGTPTALDAYHVVSTGNTGSTAILDGFTITLGNAFGSTLDGSGAGLFCAPTITGILSPRIEHCIFTSNVAAEDGAAVYVNGYQTGGSSASPNFNYCSFSMNSATGYGGAVYLGSYYSGASASPKFENCFFNYNSAGLTGNLVVAVSGGSGEVYPVFTNCTLYGNGSNDEIMYQSNGFPGSVTLNNCIAYNIDMYSNVTITANNTNANSPYISGINNISADPLFVNPGGGDFRLQCFSPGVDLGSAGFATLPNDLDGNPRVSNATIDMGAYEGTFTLPIVNANANSTNICTGGLLTLTGSGDPIISYSWTSGASDGVPFSPFSTDTYTVTAVDGSGCPGSDTITVFVNSLPVITANATTSGVCAGGSVTLYGTGGFPGAYTWSHGVNDNLPFMPASTQTYTVTGIDVNGCQAIDQITVIVEDTVGFDAGNNIDVCRTGTPFVTLSGNSAGIPYTWTTLGSGSWVNGSSLTPDYYLSGADASGTFVKIVLEITPAYCPFLSDTLTLFMQDPTSAFAGGDISYCSGVISGANLSASTTNSSGIIWSSTGTGSFSSNTSINSIYTFSPADNAGGIINIVLESIPVNAACPHVYDTLSVNIHPLPTFNLGPDVTICETDSILLNTTVTGGTPPYNYNWGSIGTISTANNEYYFPTATSNINLYLMDTYGCVATDTILVNIDASETLTINMHVGAGVLTDGTLYVLKFRPQQLAYDTMFPYPFSAGTGTITFNSFPHGSYLLKVVPDTTLYPTLLPTYFGDAFQWDAATRIDHSCISPFVADINMLALLGGTGNGSISGFILEDVGFGARPGGGFNHVMAPGGPLKGIDVKLGKNPGGGIQARTMSDTTGYYHFDSIPDDSYRIYVDIPGLPMDSFYIVNVQADSAINLNYYADSNSVFPVLATNVGLHHYASASVTTFEMYPNPATSKTSLVFSSEKQNQATVNILDITGKQVMHITLTNLPKGKHEYQLNFDKQQLQSGIYFIELLNENGRQTRKLVIE